MTREELLVELVELREMESALHRRWFRSCVSRAAGRVGQDFVLETWIDFCDVCERCDVIEDSLGFGEDS